jgi:hypothetical protein
MVQIILLYHVHENNSSGENLINHQIKQMHINIWNINPLTLIYDQPVVQHESVHLLPFQSFYFKFQNIKYKIQKGLEKALFC